jgi:hypothetical protein
MGRGWRALRSASRIASARLGYRRGRRSTHRLGLARLGRGRIFAHGRALLELRCGRSRRRGEARRGTKQNFETNFVKLFFPNHLDLIESFLRES